MVDCGNKPPGQKDLKRRIDAYHALLDGGDSKLAKLAEECEKANARAEKLEGALKTIMLQFYDKKLCAKVAMEAMKNENKKDRNTQG